MFKRRLLLGMALLLLCALWVPGLQAQEASETDVQFIELAGPAASRDAEISSLTWHGDTLLLVTENPFIYAQEGEVGRFFALSREAINEYLDADDPAPLEPRPVPIFGPDIQETVGGYAVSFDGFEAAAVATDLGYFIDDRVFLTIEADTVDPDDPTMRSYVVSGAVAPDLGSITLDLDTFVELPRQTDFNNMSYESALLADGELVLFYEANGVEVNEEAAAYRVDLQSGELSTTPLENLPYRITDATTPDADGVFWVINYFFPGEDFLGTESDPLFEAYGRGESQTGFGGFVERLVAYQLTDDGINLVDTAPVQLRMTEESNGRNWEGIARLDDRGFLVVTDRFPQTLLGFVPAE